VSAAAGDLAAGGPAAGAAAGDHAAGGPAAGLTATDAGTVFGTAGYMSPEQVRGQAVDHRSDIFAFGAVLYEMLAGGRAFPGATPVERGHAILKDEPPAFAAARGVPPAVEWVVWRCLEKEPAQRFQSARDLAFSLEAAAELPSGSAPQAPLKARSRRATVATLGAVVLATVIAGLAYVSWRQAASPTAPEGGGAARGAAPATTPHYQRVSFRRGAITSARFAPDGASVIYAAAFEGAPSHVYSAIPGNPEARQLFGPRVGLLGVSRTGDVALAITSKPGEDKVGTLARAPLAGGVPREVQESVLLADWSPDGASLMVVRAIPGRISLEYPTGTVLFATTDGMISGARLAPGGDRVAFFNLPRASDTRGSLDVVDATGQRRTLAGPFADMRGLAWSPDGREVWFTATRAGLANELRAVTLDGRERVVTEVPGTLVIEDIARDGRVLVRREDLRYRVVGRGPGDAKPRDLSWFDGTKPTDLSRDGRHLLFVEGLDAAPTEVESYLRRTDGAPAVRLGPGWGFALSPDGKWALHSPRFPYDRVQLLPTGAGEPRPLPAGAIAEYHWASFFPDGKAVLVVGREPGKQYRLWVQPVDGTPPRPIGPAGVVATGDPIAPDGTRVAVVRPDQPPALMPATGGPLQPLPGLQRTHVPIGWSDDGKALFVVERAPEFPVRVARFELATGRLTPWAEVGPAGDAATRSSHTGQLGADGKAWVLGYVQLFSDLYLVEGLR
jgi:hypothetical protein